MTIGRVHIFNRTSNDAAVTNISTTMEQLRMENAEIDEELTKQEYELLKSFDRCILGHEQTNDKQP